MCGEDKEDRSKKYLATIKSFLKKDENDKGMLIITSCNWTEQELMNWLNNEFKIEDRIINGNFSFGGSEGALTTTLFLTLN